MTDLGRLARTLRAESIGCGFEAGIELKEAAAHLDAYARILAASPDVREIETRHDKCRAEEFAGYNKLAIKNASLEGYTYSKDALTDALLDRATLLDVVRRKDAEIRDLRAMAAPDSDYGKMIMRICRQRNRQHYRADLLREKLDAARTALQEERERHAGTRARVQALEAYAREVEMVAAAISRPASGRSTRASTL